MADCAKLLQHSQKKIADLKRFSEEMKDGDPVALRIGRSTILAVGQIIGDYEKASQEREL